MATKAQKFRLGVFLTSGVLIILVSLVVIAGGKLSQKRDTYYIKFQDESISGLDVGGKVNYHGISVGRVEDIKISEKDVTSIVVTISVDGGTPIKNDVSAVLSPVGITGLNAIELKGGSNESDLMPVESYIRVEQSALGSITNKAVSITEQLDLLIKSLNKLADSNNIDNISSIIQNLDDILTENRSSLEGTMQNLEAISGDVSRFTNVLDAKIDTLASATTQTLNSINAILANESIGNIMANVDSLSADLANADLDVLIQSLNSSVIRLEATLNTIDNTVVRSRRDWFDILDNARETMENLSEFSKQINDSPAALLKN